ncbi:Collagen Alpha-5(Vi) Chain [Manis pentadactyla]|nr:Collagen Alpha-5(Vi) Chain [Manis pentadactyla]
MTNAVVQGLSAVVGAGRQLQPGQKQGKAGPARNAGTPCLYLSAQLGQTSSCGGQKVAVCPARKVLPGAEPLLGPGPGTGQRARCPRRCRYECPWSPRLP